MKEFLPFLMKIECIDSIKRLIPGRIARSQQWTGHKHFTFSYATTSGLKFMMKKWGTAQELFVITSKEESEAVRESILDIYTSSK